MDTLILIYEILFMFGECNPTLDHISGVFLFEATLWLIAFSAYFFTNCFNILDFAVVFKDAVGERARTEGVRYSARHPIFSTSEI